MGAALAFVGPLFAGLASAIGKVVAWLLAHPVALALVVIAVLALAVRFEHGQVLEARATLAAQKTADVALLLQCKNNAAALSSALARQNAAVAALSADAARSRATSANALVVARSAGAAYSRAEAALLAARRKPDQDACAAADQLILGVR